MLRQLQIFLLVSTRIEKALLPFGINQMICFASETSETNDPIS